MEFVRNVLDGEEPFFISDEATIYDVSMASPQELRQRPGSPEDLKLPLWRLLPILRA